MLYISNVNLRKNTARANHVNSLIRANENLRLNVKFKTSRVVKRTIKSKLKFCIDKGSWLALKCKEIIP